MTMRDPQGPSLLIDAVRHRLKAECITGNEGTRRRVAIVADHLPVLINILDDLQRMLNGNPVRAPTRVFPGPFGWVSEAFGVRCRDRCAVTWPGGVRCRTSSRVTARPWRSHAPRLGSRMTTTRCRELDRGIVL
jgi:hypothetical protein